MARQRAVTGNGRCYRNPRCGRVGGRRPRRSQVRAAPGPKGGGKLRITTTATTSTVRDPGRGKSRWAGGRETRWARRRDGGRPASGRPQPRARPPGLIDLRAAVATNDRVKRGRWEVWRGGAARSEPWGGVMVVTGARCERGHAGGGHEKGGRSGDWVGAMEGRRTAAQAAAGSGATSRPGITRLTSPRTARSSAGGRSSLAQRSLRSGVQSAGSLSSGGGCGPERSPWVGGGCYGLGSRHAGEIRRVDGREIGWARRKSGGTGPLRPAAACGADTRPCGSELPSSTHDRVSARSYHGSAVLHEKRITRGWSGGRFKRPGTGPRPRRTPRRAGSADARALARCTTPPRANGRPVPPPPRTASRDRPDRAGPAAARPCRARAEGRDPLEADVQPALRHPLHAPDHPIRDAETDLEAFPERLETGRRSEEHSALHGHAARDGIGARRGTEGVRRQTCATGRALRPLRSLQRRARPSTDGRRIRRGPADRWRPRENPPWRSARPARSSVRNARPSRAREGPSDPLPRHAPPHAARRPRTRTARPARAPLAPPRARGSAAG